MSRLDRPGRVGRLLRTAGALAVVGVSGCGKSGPPPAFARPPSPVTVAVATSADVPRYLDEVGRCVASASVTVMPQVSGRITAVDVVDGADVDERTPLFTIDARPYAARAAEARAKAQAADADVAVARAARKTAAARVATSKSRREEARAVSVAGKATADAARGETAAAEADAARAADDRQRMDAMGASGAVSQQELMRARALAEAAAARVDAARRREAAAVAQAGEGVAAEQSAEDAIREAESVLAEADARVTAAVAVAAQAEAAIEAARLDVEFCTIRSPLVGRAGERLVDVGDIVTANVTPLLSIQRVDPCYVELSVTEQDLAAVQRALAKGAVTAQVRLPDETGEGRSGPVTFLDNQVRDATGTVRLRVTLENADRRFWPGRFVRVRVVTEILVGAVLVPASAPQVSASGPFVYVVRPDGTAELRPATPGQRQGDLVVIERGVAAGERVVVEGQVGVMPGGAVRVIEPSPPPAPGAAPGAMR